MAVSGYGKRSVLGQRPRRAGDFGHLAPREASIAAHIDRLPEGAAIDVKTLARELPAYGQMAVRSALTRLSEAGHLRRIRENVGVGCTRWVFRTYFSRAARDDAWWAAFLAGEVADVLDRELPTPPDRSDVRRQQQQQPQSQSSVVRARPPARPQRSAAYELLAALGRTDPRMTLSAAECAGLEGLASQWLARGADAAQLALALTAGLPRQVHSPAALARSRLLAKLPPEPVEPSPSPRPPQRLMECTDCGVPGCPEALPGGLCRTCRGAPEAPLSDAFTAEEVRARVALLRAIRRSGDGDRDGEHDHETSGR